jgi:hypothetical protein
MIKPDKYRIEADMEWLRSMGFPCKEKDGWIELDGFIRYYGKEIPCPKAFDFVRTVNKTVDFSRVKDFPEDFLPNLEHIEGWIGFGIETFPKGLLKSLITCGLGIVLSNLDELPREAFPNLTETGCFVFGSYFDVKLHDYPKNLVRYGKHQINREVRFEFFIKTKRLEEEIKKTKLRLEALIEEIKKMNK